MVSSASSFTVKSKQLRQSLGNIGFLTIFGGSLIVLAVSVFLIFLWAGKGSDGGAQITGLWRWIMLHNWGTRAVTLSTLLLRASTSAQAAVCTSLVAALILERHHVRVSQLTQFSTTRSVNNGLRQLIQEILCSRSTSLVLRMETGLLILLALASLGIQFSSTILLPDFSIVSLPQAPERIRQNVALSSQIDSIALANTLSMKFNMPDASHAIFGELEVPGNYGAEPNEQGV
ncbi:hypothetical protein F4821DRAFT_280604 [Hypoxylon rubiginosum]|uniref:Uncharacterized protein n=1 Tax=Hypoxylon rubiginosum TaxID=110542 RepID=A0ACC0CTM0_9PEZI|nr:hypothetical protein F4821DRAFT_280604 [Hypoxylon rubiginosum]